MSQEITNADIYSVLLDLKGDLGEMKGTLAGQAKAFAEHVLSDAALAQDVQKLQLGAARQRGVIAALTTVGSVIGAGVGYAVELMTRNH